MRGAISDLRATIRSFGRGEYALPAHFEKIIPAGELATLRGIVEEIRALNDECVGLRIGECQLLLGTDPRPEEIRRALMALYERLVPLRLERPNSRDRGEPVLRFERITLELLPGLDRIMELNPSVHPRCLITPQDYAAWLLYCATWRPLVAFTPRAGGLQVTWRVDPERREYCLGVLSLYRWQYEGELAAVLKRAGDMTPTLGPGGDAAARQRLKAMAEDLEAMRPLLVRNYRASRSLVSLGPGLCVAWHWNLGEVVGNVLVAPDERAMLTAEHDLDHMEILSVDREGLLASQDMPWIRSIDLDLTEGGAALAANLYIVERLYERVFAMYERVDTAAVLARFRTPAEEAGSDVQGDGADEAIAVAVQRSDDGAPETEPLASEVVASPPRRVRGMRFERFVRLLRRLGCETRPGKGSEVNVYRPGGRIARIGHHLRNPELSPVLVRIVLEQLGIPVVDFLAVA